MVDEVTIREATAGDAEAISALVVSLAPFYLADPADREAAKPFFDSVSAEMQRKILTGWGCQCHVAESGGEIVGVLGIRQATHLYHLFVAETFHGRGIARRLWRTAKAAARAAGNPGRFTVYSSLHAVPVYERFGFRPIGPKVHQHGVAYVPMVLDEREDGGRSG